MAIKGKTHRQMTIEKEADTLQRLVDKTQRKIDRLRTEAAELDAKRRESKTTQSA